MMESTQRSALARLLNGLKREHHDYRPSLEVFPTLNIDKVAGEMALATTGAGRGAREEPASDSIAFDDVENRIIERVEAEKNAAHGLLLDELRTYKERLTSLDFEGRFGTIRQAAPAAVSEFRSEAAQGRDEMHRLRRHLRDLEVERDEFRRRNKLKRTARWASGGNLTLKVGILLAIFVRDWQRRFDGGLCNGPAHGGDQSVAADRGIVRCRRHRSHRTYRRAARHQPCFESGSPLVVGDLWRDRRGSPAMGRQCRPRARARAGGGPDVGLRRAARGLSHPAAIGRPTH